VEIVKRKSRVKYREKLYVNGKEIKSPFFDKKTDAKNWKNEMRSQKLEPELFFKLEKSKLGFGELAKEWLERVKYKNAPRTYESYSSVTEKHLMPYLSNILVKDLKSSHGYDLIKRLVNEDHNPTGVNIILGILKRVMNDALERELIDKNPILKVRPLKVHPRNEVYWTKHEISQFLRANINDVNYALYVVAVNSGMRRGELAGLCWDRIDFERNQIEVSRTRDRHGLHETVKNGIRRHVPMNHEVRRVLEELRRRQDHLQFIFCEAPGEPFNVHHLYRDFSKVQKRAGLQRRIRFHDIRHTFASQFMMGGGNLYDLQKILGHTKIEMTMRYAHLSADHLATAINVISFSGTTDNNISKLEVNRPVLGLNLSAV
jgi:integrase